MPNEHPFYGRKWGALAQRLLIYNHEKGVTFYDYKLDVTFPMQELLIYIQKKDVT